MSSLLRQTGSSIFFVPIVVVLAVITAGRGMGESIPIPFLLVYAAVTIAAFGGGSRMGIGAGVLASGFVVHSTFTGYGPPTLTGSGFAAIAGCALFVLSGALLGRVRDRNESLVEDLVEARTSLEATVGVRTQELAARNEELAKEIIERENAEREVSRYETRVAHTQRLESIGILAGGFAHDFNNLLTAVRGNIELLREQGTEPKNRELLGDIDDATTRAADLCNQVLSYSGQGELVSSVFDIRGVVEESVRFLEASISKKIRFNVSGEGAVVFADRTQIGQIVVNLLSNAAQAVVDVGLIGSDVRMIEITEEDLSSYLLGEKLVPGRYACLEVADNGAGMTDQEQAKIFDPFFTTKAEGRGLGLAVVFGAVRAHGGAIRVKSSVGVGTRFRFVMPESDLPAVDPLHSDPNPGPQVKTQDTTAAENEEEAAQRGLVLVADDEEVIRRILVKNLELAGWRTIQAESGREAIARFQENPDIVLVLVDLTMPEMDGQQVIEELHRLAPSLPVVLMSGYRPDEGEGIQPTAFLQKPFYGKAVVELVSELVPRPGTGTRPS